MNRNVHRAALVAILAVLVCMGAAGAQNPPHARLVAQLGHRDLVSSVAFSPDGKTVATASWDKTARLWEAASGKELRVLDGHSDDVYSAVFSPDGKRIVTAAGDGTIRIWEAATGKELLRIRGHGERVWSAVFSPDGREILTGEWDNIAVLYDAQTGKEVRRFAGHTASVFAAVFSPDGKYVLTGSQDKTARLWDAATGKELRRFSGHTAQINSVVFSPEGKYVLTGSQDKTARLWDAATGELVRTLAANAEVHKVAISPDGTMVLTANQNGSRLWETATGRELRLMADGSAWAGTFAPDGKTVWVGDYDGKVRSWQVATGAAMITLEGGAVDVMAVAISPDGSRLLTGGRDALAHEWNVTTGGEIRQLTHKGVVTSVKFSPDGQQMLTGSADATAKLWDVDSGAELKSFAQAMACTSVGFWLTNEYVLTGNMDGTAELWSTKSGGTEQGVDVGRNGSEIANNWVTAVSMGSDGRALLTASWDGTARLWDVLNGKEVRRMKSPDRLNAAVISRDETRVLTASDDKLARLWDSIGEKELLKFAGHTGPVHAAVFSPDERTVLTGSADKTARLWDVATGKELRRLEGHSQSVQAVAFTPDGTRAVTGSLDGTTKIWDVATGKELASLISFAGGRWVVVDTEGRFDTSDLDGGAPLQWVVDDAPFHALPLEIFMRDYYTPGLLARVMKGEKLPEVRSIAKIQNRVQPEVSVMSVTPSQKTAGRVDVTVHAASVTDAKGMKSGLHDLRLFRDGQMVADGFRVGTLTDGDFVFRDVMLKSDAKKVTFTAYAFNSERIKSATASLDYEVKAPVSTAVKRRAFLLQVGVNHTAARGCELKYSVNDAETMSAALSERLRTEGFEVKVVKLESVGADTQAASKDAIRARLKEIAAKATPDDAFFMSFSGHGYSAPGGAFFVLPSDVQGSCADAAELKNLISADELADWLRPIDAGEMTLILDACYSAESVQAGDFKPGPMGSRGLGQVAYDKRMRVLAASQSDAVAHEYDYLHQGLLSYVLVKDGLDRFLADWKPKNGQITVGEWLSYAAAKVPDFKPAAPAGENKGSKVEVTVEGHKSAGQVPALFDFSRTDTLVLAK